LVKELQAKLVKPDSKICPGRPGMLIGPYFGGIPCPRCGKQMSRSTCASTEEFKKLSHELNLVSHYAMYPEERPKDATR
jgi:hypothetical protein